MSETPEVMKQMEVVDGELPCVGRYWLRNREGTFWLRNHAGSNRLLSPGTTEVQYYWYIGPLEEPPVFVDPVEDEADCG